MKNLFFSVLLFALFVGEAPSDEHHDHSEETEESHAPRFGPNKGVTDANDQDGFKLNSQSYKNFKIELSTLKGKGPWIVPRSAIVHSREETHVYRFKDGFFKNFDVEIVKKTGSSATIKGGDLGSGDQLATKGLGFLMIVDQAVFGEEIAHEH